jgi:hypothetical protein
VSTNTEKDVRVANLRKLKLSAQDLHARVKTKGYSYWQGLLNGSRPFAEKAARSIEDDLGLPRGWLDRDESAAHADAPFRDLSAFEAQLVTMFRQIGDAAGPEEQQSALVDMNDRLARATGTTPARKHGKIIEDRAAASKDSKARKISK